MMSNRAKSQSDCSLGMDQRITRRDYLNSALLASGSVLLNAACPLDLLAQQEDWDGYGGVGDYSQANGNTFAVAAEAHKIRDRVFESLPADVIDTGEELDCVVVGGGISGLAAALFFKRKAGPNRTCLVLENHAIFGGEARRNEFVVDGQRLIAHQGSAMFFPPRAGTFLGISTRPSASIDGSFRIRPGAAATPKFLLGERHTPTVGSTPDSSSAPSSGKHRANGWSIRGARSWPARPSPTRPAASCSPCAGRGSQKCRRLTATPSRAIWTASLSRMT